MSGVRVDSVTGLVSAGGGITVAGLEECRGREWNSGLSMLLVFLLVFISEGNDMDVSLDLRDLCDGNNNQYIKILKIPVDSRRQVQNLLAPTELWITINSDNLSTPRDR